MNSATKLAIAGVTAAALIAAGIATDKPTAEAMPAPQAKQASPADDIAAAVDRNTAAQTQVLRELTRQLSGISGTLDDLETRIGRLERGDNSPHMTDSPPATSVGTSTSTANTATGSCAAGVCGVRYSAPVRRAVTTQTYSGPRGVFGGRWAPLRRVARFRPLRRLFGRRR